MRGVLSHYDEEMLSVMLAGAAGGFWMESDWPKDARVVDIRRNWQMNTWDIIWTSAEFDEIPEGNLWPERSPQLMTHFIEKR